MKVSKKGTPREDGGNKFRGRWEVDSRNKSRYYLRTGITAPSRPTSKGESRPLHPHTSSRVYCTSTIEHFLTKKIRPESQIKCTAATRPPLRALVNQPARLDFSAFLDRDLSSNNTALFTKSTAGSSGRAAMINRRREAGEETAADAGRRAAPGCRALGNDFSMHMLIWKRALLSQIHRNESQTMHRARARPRTRRPDLGVCMY
ncbi:hypothetical protein EVAR_33062_1 [Eumeta japonica]|uniref:Uncharacterized protein n=1 Tax=Eumeta variegata TaxID=151549 RepID=A0A4C1WUM8_EUMVA|nr:hypothetical protein EVAR_33062_1 [Eumeta japonica]